MTCVLAQHGERSPADPSPGQLGQELVRGGGWSWMPGAEGAGLWSCWAVGGQGKPARRRGQERAGLRGERGHCLEELSLETESPEAALIVCLHPGCSCLWVPEMPLFPLSLGHDSGSRLQEPGEKSFISFLLFFFWQVCLISFELPLFGPKNAQRVIRRSEYFCTAILKDGPSSLAASEIGVAAETGDLLKAAEQPEAFSL